MKSSINVQWMVGLLLILTAVMTEGCKEDVLPKPKAQLRLEYEDAAYSVIDTDCPFVFERSNKAKESINSKCWINLVYPELNAQVNITYRPIDNNLKELFMEAEKLTFNHSIKADGISSKPYEDKARRVFGAVFEVTGNAASPVQFHITDSTDHFLTGAIYFDVQPNYDSIKPAAHYIQKDVIHLFESLKWKEK